MNKTRKIALAAMFAALCCVATYVVKIPTPTKGYFNVGDIVVIISGLLLGPVWGAAAAGIGSMFTDVFSGYMVYAPATLVIKAAVAATAVLVFRKMGKKGPGLVIGAVTGEILMVLGYFAFECSLMMVQSAENVSFYAAAAAAAAGIPMNILQGVVGIAGAVILYGIIQKNSYLKKFFDTL